VSCGALHKLPVIPLALSCAKGAKPGDLPFLT
jgi:hypothetical protein